MESINKKYNIGIEVLTPLSVGAGSEKDWVKGVDFVVKDKKLYHLNLKKMIFNKIDIYKLSNAFSKRDTNGVIQLIGNKLDTVSDDIMPLPISTDNDIKTFIKNELSGKPVLPGSSLKGAIRSILYQYLEVKGRSEKEVFGSSSVGDEFMRFIKISDAEFDKTELINSKIFNLFKYNSEWLGGWKHEKSVTNSSYRAIGFNTIYECILPSEKSFIPIMLSPFQYDLYEKNIKPHIKTGMKRPLLTNDITALFKLINDHSLKYLKKEKLFFQNFETQNTDLIIDSIDSLINQIPRDNSYCILKMSAGSGFHSITGDWKFDNYYSGSLGRKFIKDAKPKSRKIAIVGEDNFSLMGFVKLWKITEAEINQILGKRNKELEEIDNQKHNDDKEGQNEVDRIEKEKRLLEEYNLIVDEADSLYQKEEFKKALDQYKKAGNIYTLGTRHQSQIDKIELEIKIKGIDDLEKEQIVARKNQMIEAGLSVLDEKNTLGDFTVKNFNLLEKKINRWMKVAAIKDGKIPENQYSFLISSLKRVYSTLNKRDKKEWAIFNEGVWTKIVRWTNESIAEQWFNEIIKDD